MAKKSNTGTSRRSANVTANRRLHRRPSPSSHRHSLDYLERQSLRPFRVVDRAPAQRPAIDDRRTYHPLGEARPVYRADGVPASISKRLYDAPRSIKTVSAKRNVPRQLAKAVQKRLAQHNRFGPVLDRATRAIRVFHNPLSVPLCHARRIRREVLHALGKAGGGVARPRFKEESRIKC